MALAARVARGTRFAWTATELRSVDPARVGRLGEELCAERLTQLGFEILGRRVETPFGELDLLARRAGASWCFEIKSSRAQRASTEPRWAPARRLSRRQRGRIERAARCCHALLGAQGPLRIALVEIWIDARGRLADWRVTRLQ